MNRRLIVGLCLLFIASRMPFINTNPVFFDSAGYLKAFSQPNLMDAILGVHFPLHDGYIILFWPFYHLAKILSGDYALAVIAGQIILGLVTIVLFYKCVSYIADKRIAFIAAIIISLTPLFWISNVTILYEISYLGFYFSAMYLLMQYLLQKKVRYLYVSAVLLCMGMFTHMMLVLWMPLYFAVVYFKSPKQLLKVIITVGLFFIGIMILRTLIVTIASPNDLVYVFEHLYMGNYNNAGSPSLTLNSFLASARNVLIPLMRGYTSLIAIIGFVTLGVVFFKNKTYFIYGLLWIAPSFIALQFWDAQLPGRYAILTGFGLAFMAGYFLKKQVLATALIICYLLFVSIPALNLLRFDIPYLQLAGYAKSLPADSLLIDSHFSRRQLQDTFKGKLISVNEPNMGRDIIEKEINNYLKNNKSVYISSPALTDPYGLYSGPYLHTLSLSYAKPPELKPVIEKYTLAQVKVINTADNLSIYKIISTNDHPSPQIKSMKNHYRRLDNFDPLWHLYRVTEKFILSLL